MSLDYDELAAIFAALGDAESLKILERAREELRSGKRTVSELHLTQRQYYKRMKSLTETGILKKKKHSENIYSPTALGEILGGTIRDVSAILPDLEVIERSRELGEINGSPPDDPRIAKLLRRVAGGEISVITDYKSLVEHTNAEIETAEHEILLASRYIDLAVWHSLMRSLERGVKLYAISDVKINVPQILSILKDALWSQDVTKTVKTMLSSDNINFRFHELPYSFSVVDGDQCTVELAYPPERRRNFLCGISMINRTLGEQLKGLFQRLWTLSEKVPEVNGALKLFGG
jgi:DNA-binding transcriptional ArsR family regulator